MTFDISIISPSGAVGNEFLARDFPSAAEAEAWGTRQAKAIGEPFDFIRVREVQTTEEIEF